MKKIEINVVQGEQILKKFHIEEKSFKTANGTVTGLVYRCETKGLTGFSEGYLNGSVIMNAQNEPIGTFTRPPMELVKDEKFQVQFTKTAPFDCICLSIEDFAPPSAPTPIVKYKPQNVKTKEEIEWELKQMEKILPPPNPAPSY